MRELLLLLFPLLLCTRIRIQVELDYQKKDQGWEYFILLSFGFLRFSYGYSLHSSTWAFYLGPFSFSWKGAQKEGDLFQTLSLLLHLSHYRRLFSLLQLKGESFSLFLAGNLLGDPALTGMGVGLCFSLAGILSSSLVRGTPVPVLHIKTRFLGEPQLHFQGIITTRLGYSIRTVLFYFIQTGIRRRRRASN